MRRVVIAAVMFFALIACLEWRVHPRLEELTGTPASPILQTTAQLEQIAEALRQHSSLLAAIAIVLGPTGSAELTQCISLVELRSRDPLVEFGVIKAVLLDGDNCLDRWGHEISVMKIGGAFWVTSSGPDGQLSAGNDDLSVRVATLPLYQWK
jgi:hypothetical protein